MALLDPVYRAEARPPPPDVTVAAFAARRHAVASTAELRDLGLSRSGIARRVASGRLHPWYRGVYAIGHTSLTREGRWTAAVLACGDGAVLSHRDAAALWGLRETARTRIDVTVRGAGRAGPRGIDVHRSRVLDAADVTERDHIPVTTVARTLVDLAEVLDGGALRRAVEQAEVLRLLDVAAVADAVSRLNGRRRAGVLLGMLDVEPPPTRSELERRFLELCAEASIPPPQVNVHVGDIEVDFLWRDARLIVETDGAAVHHTRAAFERDRQRDATLTAAGYRVVRFTWRQLTEGPAGVIEVLRRLLTPVS